MPSTLRILFAPLLAMTVVACASHDAHVQAILSQQMARLPRDGVSLARLYPRAHHRTVSPSSNHVLAIYNDANELINSPLEDLRALLAAETARGRPVTDVYVVSHGWNFTLQEGIKNYQSYISAFGEASELLRACAGEAFNPAFVFVVWTSVSQPFQAAARSILPYGLDASLGWLTSLLDMPFHLTSAWNESSKAYVNALGPVGDREIVGAGRDVSVAQILVLMLDDLRIERLHLVGHSYGAKLLTLAAVHAGIMKASPDRSIASLVCFNPAFHPLELKYVWDLNGPLGTPRLVTEDAVCAALAQIGRKAIVYSTHDRATGWMFGASQVFMNNGQVEWVNDFIDNTAPEAWYLWPFTLLERTLQLGWNVGTSAFQWSATTIVNLPFDFWHHVSHNDTLGDGAWYGYPFNAVHFFVPLDALFVGRDSDKLGLFRPAYPALGRSGLDAHSAGRPFLGVQAFALHRFVDPAGSTRVSAKDFLSMCVHPHLERPAGLAHFDDPGRMYSFDASAVFKSWMPPAGSHGDLRLTEVAFHYPLACGCDLAVRNIDCTINFVFNFTQPRP